MTELDFEKRSKSLHPTLHTLLIFTSTQSETAYVIRVREMKLCIATLYKLEKIARRICRVIVYEMKLFVFTSYRKNLKFEYLSLKPTPNIV
jgi:hypothetical protein